MNKKILISFILIFSILSVQVYAEKNIFNALGTESPISDSSMETAVTRADFVTALVRLIGFRGENTEAVPFTDTDEKISGILSFALQYGLISSGESFRPYAPVTKNECSKMCVSALNRTYEAVNHGGYPAGYLSVAERAKLFKGVNFKNDILDAENFYILTDNLLDVDMLAPVGVTKDGVEYREYSTLLKEYYNIDKIYAVVTGNGISGLYDNESKTAKNRVRLGDDEFFYEGASRLGERVCAYVNGDDEAVLLKPYRNKEITIKSEDVINYADGSVYYTEGAKKLHARTDKAPAVLYNEVSCNYIPVSTFIRRDNSYITLTDNDSDGIYEVIRVYEGKTLYVSGVSAASKYITDKNGEKKIDLSGETEFDIFSDGAKISLDDISGGMLLTYYMSLDEGCCKIEVGKEEVTGNITAYDKDRKNIYIDDKVYKYGSYFEKHYFNKMTVGGNATFLINTEGTIEIMRDDEASGIRYGYVLDLTKEKGLSGKVKIRIFTQNGEDAVFEISKNIMIDGKAERSADAALAVLAPGNAVERQLIRFGTDKNGLVSVIDTKGATGYVTGDENINNNLTLYEFPDTAVTHDTIWYSKTSAVIHPYFAISGSSVVMAVAEGDSIDNSKRCRILDSAYINSHTSYKRANLRPYNVSEKDGSVGCLVVLDTNAALKEVSDDSTIGIVESVSAAVNEEGTICTKLVVYSNSYYHDIFAVDDDVVKVIKDKKIAPGDCIRYDVDVSGNITAIAKDVDAETLTVLKNISNQLYTNYYCAKVYSVGEKYMTVMPKNVGGISGSADGIKYTFPNPSKVIVYDRKNKTLRESGVNEIESYAGAGDECSDIIITTYDGVPRYFILYK